MSRTAEFQAELAMDYDRLKEIKAFDDTKSGVKGLVDSGIEEIPRIFIRPPDELDEELTQGKSTLHCPVIDLSGIEVQDHRNKVIDEIREASEKWGFFQLINHGVPSSVLEGMIDGIREFHELDVELKKEYYSRDPTRRVRYESNFDLYQSKTANWRDTLNISMLVSGHVEPEEIPAICRDVSVEYINHVTKLGETIFSILSEALGLKPDHLKDDMECAKGKSVVCHYYPACPQPELTLGAAKHTDPSFLTILLQDQIGGLQVLHSNQWIDVEPVAQGLVVNIGESLQMLSNDKFVSANHRVLSNRVGPRISVAFFFNGGFAPPKIYGPIKDLISEENPLVYKDFTVSDYISKFMCRPLGKSALDLFRL